MNEEEKKETPDTLFESEQEENPVTYLETEEEVEEEASTLAFEGSESVSDSTGWWFSVIISVVVIAVADWGVYTLGQNFFWSEQNLYIISLGILFIVSLLNAFMLARQGKDTRSILIINGLMALVAGIILSVSRFISNTAFWTFFNLIAQPINALILGILASYLITKFIKKPSRSVDLESKE